MRPCQIATYSKRFGVVMRSYVPVEDAVLLLEPERGLVYARFKRMPKRVFSVGSLISFCAEEKTSGRLLLCDVALEALPARWVTQDILFLHHFCELCHRFVFSAEDASAVFALLKEFWRDCAVDETDIEFKKLRILSNFFVGLGSYVPYHCDMNSSFDDCDKDIVKKRCIKRWLRECIFAAEPSYALKTIHFLTI